MISTTKRLLINELLATGHEKLKDLSLDDPIVESMFEFLENADNDIELLKVIIKKLYQLYQSQDDHLRMLVLSFLPALVAIYTRSVHNCYNLPKSDFHSLAILLLSIYNTEIIDAKTGELKTIDIRLISLSKPSVYHEPNTNHSVQATLPTEQMLARINNPAESKISIFGPYEMVESVNTGNYQSVCTVLLKVYNQHMSQMGHYSHASLCHHYLALLRQGASVNMRQHIESLLAGGTSLPTQQSHSAQVLPRNCVHIHFCSELLTELMRSVYFCFYNELEDIALDLIDEIGKRATHRLYADVLLMTNAVKNTLAIKNEDKLKPRRHRTRTSQSVSSVNPSSHHATSAGSSLHRKTAITNASFKTRKLPDDIPIVTSNATPNANPNLANLAARQSKMMASAHNGGAKGVLRKSLDSIHEESHGGRPTTTNTTTVLSTAVPVKQRKGVMHLLKEFKDKPKRSSASGRNNCLETSTPNLNSSNSNSYSNIVHNNSISSDGSEINTSVAKEMIPLKPLANTHKYIDDDDDEADDDLDGDLNYGSEPNGIGYISQLNDDGNDSKSNDVILSVGKDPELMRLTFTERNDDSNGSDLSGASSRELLPASNNISDPKIFAN